MINLAKIIEIAQQAGQLVMAIYHQPSFAITNKEDNSALTQADIESHIFITDSLARLYPAIPILSEESALGHDYEIRKDWKHFFLVDPLDGTKEFIKRNGEFTINIALIENQQPIAGVIHAPALNLTYYAEKGKGAFKISKQHSVKLQIGTQTEKELRVITSRSHCCNQTQDFMGSLRNEGKTLVEITAGSALKFGLIAEGRADIYPRFSPTMEWDTAAGQILVEEMGKKMVRVDVNEGLQYNKQDLKNPGFIVQ